MLCCWRERKRIDVALKRKTRRRPMVWRVLQRLRVAGAAGGADAGLEDGV